MPVWVRLAVVIVISINNEVFPYYIESLCRDVGYEISRKQEISREGLFKRLFDQMSTAL